MSRHRRVGCDADIVAGVTNEKTSPVDVAAIRERCEAATPGPWIRDPEYASVCAPARDGECVAVCSMSDGPPAAGWVADAEFIAHAREDIPVLLAEIERLQAVVEGCHG